MTFLPPGHDQPATTRKKTEENQISEEKSSSEMFGRRKQQIKPVSRRQVTTSFRLAATMAHKGAWAMGF
jgi:hypothetical protein